MYSKAFWNWVEHYPDEFTMLYQRPQADMAGKRHSHWCLNTCSLHLCVTSWQCISGQISVCFLCFVYTDCAERLFDLVDSFAESAKRKAAVWPLQIILLILCPEITQSITKEVGGEEKANKVRGHNDKCFKSYLQMRAPSFTSVCSGAQKWALKKNTWQTKWSFGKLCETLPRHCW